MSQSLRETTKAAITVLLTLSCVPVLAAPTQECIRYNSLLAVMSQSLRETTKALKGLVVMSPELEAVAYSMYDNQVRNHETESSSRGCRG